MVDGEETEEEKKPAGGGQKARSSDANTGECFFAGNGAKTEPLDYAIILFISSSASQLNKLRLLASLENNKFLGKQDPNILNM